jgi:plastocyanin
MNAVPQNRVRSIVGLTGSMHLLCALLAGPSFASTYGSGGEAAKPSMVKVNLSEWKVQLAPARIPAGTVVFLVSNTGTIPHSFEVEGRGIEKSISQLQPGASATFKLDLRAGSYESYCPVGKGSHKMLGMMSHLTVGDAKPAAAATAKHEAMEYKTAGNEAEEHEAHEMAGEYGDGTKLMRLTGGGPVIQILPGPFPFADSAMAVISARPADQQADLTHKAHMGPYSNNVATISGDLALAAIDRGASGDSVSGTAQFTTQDGARWRAVIDRVQTKDIPFNPRFGGVIMGLFYHGASGVHTPLVPTIQSSVALWAFAHLYKNDQLVSDNAMVHIMLLSRTRRPSDWALDCWDCSDRPVEELQLQITPAPNTPPFEAPGGFLFVNWERSSGQLATL